MQLIRTGGRRLTEITLGGRAIPGIPPPPGAGDSQPAIPAPQKAALCHPLPIHTCTSVRKPSDTPSLQRKRKISHLVWRLCPQQEQTCGENSLPEGCRRMYLVALAGAVGAGCPGQPHQEHQHQLTHDLCPQIKSTFPRKGQIWKV